MKRSLLATAVSIAPLIAALAGASRAQVTISSSTNTPVATATANSGAPSNIDINAAGSIGLTSAGVAVTLNSSNVVTNEGELGATDLQPVTGILINGGNTGSFTNTGSIVLTETYAPGLDPNNDGLILGNFASGGNRYGIDVEGPGTFSGFITTTGAITIHGNASYGALIDAPITGDFQMLSVVPATSSTAATVTTGSMGIIGNNSIGLYVTPSGGIGGNVSLTGISSTGVGAEGVVINGAVGGGINISGAITTTGYRLTTRSLNPALTDLYQASELQQGGTAVSIGASVGNGILVSAAPLVQSTTNLDLDNNGVPDSLQGTGAITSYGAAPALVIGAVGTSNITIGEVGPGMTNITSGVYTPGSGSYGLIINGTVIGDGLFDQVNYPNLPASVSATAIQIGQNGGGTTTIAGGIYNSGAIDAQAYQGDSTAIHITSGSIIPTIVNNGAITANSEQDNTATTNVVPLNVNAILIDAGANVGSIVNNANLTATLTGEGGVGGTVGGIIDKSGTVTSITNTGTLGGIVNQTLISSPMPYTQTAIDLSAGTAPQTLTQMVNPNLVASTPYNDTTSYTLGQIVSENGVVYQATVAAGVAVDPASTPSVWREIGATVPAIYGSLYFGSGGTTLNVSAGTIDGAFINLGSGANTVNISGTGTTVTGYLQDGGNGTLNINIGTNAAGGGTLSDLNYADTIKANSINVGATGTLLVAADPANGTNTKFITSGASNFASGATIGLTLASIQNQLSETYVIVQTATGGTLTAGTFNSTALGNAPYLYAATPSFVSAANSGVGQSQIVLTVQQKTAAQLGVNAAEGAALSAVLAAIPNNVAIQSALLAQTTLPGFRAVYDQLLPSQGQGLFDALESATQRVGDMVSVTPDDGTRVAGSSLWVQEVNERVRRTGEESQASNAQLLGLVTGFEHMGEKGGAVGVTLAYYNDQETDAAQQVGGNVVASMVELGSYYRRAIGGFRISTRSGIGYSFFNSTRKFLETGVSETAHSSWGGYFMDGHFQTGYEVKFGRFYARPEISADYLRLAENAHDETGGDNAFDLHLANRTSTRLTGQAIMVVGRDWGKTAWLRTEFRGGFREVFSGEVGDTVANFEGGGLPFSLAPDSDKGGWATFGFSVKAGSEYSYVALEGDAEFRAGEQRYDLRLAGRSMF